MINPQSIKEDFMSRYASTYQEAEPNIGFSELFQYYSMMNSKQDIIQLGARLLSEYRARRKS
jgi:hypothetical protein